MSSCSDFLDSPHHTAALGPPDQSDKYIHAINKKPAASSTNPLKSSIMANTKQMTWVLFGMLTKSNEAIYLALSHVSLHRMAEEPLCRRHLCSEQKCSTPCHLVHLARLKVFPECRYHDSCSWMTRWHGMCHNAHSRLVVGNAHGNPHLHHSSWHNSSPARSEYRVALMEPLPSMAIQNPPHKDTTNGGTTATPKDHSLRDAAHDAEPPRMPPNTSQGLPTYFHFRIMRSIT
jgi:hypothetical protein